LHVRAIVEKPKGRVKKKKPVLEKIVIPPSEDLN